MTLPRRTYDTIGEYEREPFILTGYRDCEGKKISRSALLCAFSAFELHNQTLNIWVHLLGTIYFMYRCAVSFSEIDSNPSIAIFHLSSVCCLGLSTAYHCFQPISEKMYHFLLRMDYLGIVVQVAGSYVPGIYLGFRCFPAAQWTHCAITALFTVLAVASSGVSPTSALGKVRIPIVVGLVAYGVVPLLHWCTLSRMEDIQMFGYGVVRMLLLYAIGFFFFRSRFPEVMMPGAFDTFMSSHQIWHAFVLVAAMSWDSTCTEVVRRYSSRQCEDIWYAQ